LSGPTPLWYTTRGAGIVVLLLLTAVVVLGVLTTQRWGAAGVPRFVSNDLHRSLALLTLVFLGLHIVTAILDSFAHLGLIDALVQFASKYRPIWLGLGVLSAELFVALIITSLARASLGYRAWRLTHWLAYASWPIALLHGLGTGSDTKALWSLLINAACVAAVLGAIGWRIIAGWPRSYGIRLAAGSASAIGILLLIGWMAIGPLKPGWAAAAGTPTNLLPRTAASTLTAGSTPGTAALTVGLRDQLQGTLTENGGGLRLDLRDVSNSAIRIIVTVADSQASTGTLEVRQNGQTLCSSSASIAQEVSASCAGTIVTIGALQQLDDGAITGVMLTGSRG